MKKVKDCSTCVHESKSKSSSPCCKCSVIQCKHVSITSFWKKK